MTSTIKIFLINKVSLLNHAATQLQAIYGIDLLNECQSCSNKDIDDIYSTTRRPGGMLAYFYSTRSTLLPNIAYSGVTMLKITVKRLKHCIYGTKYQCRLSRHLNFATFAQAKLDKYDSIQTIEIMHENPPGTSPPPDKGNMIR